MIHEEENGSKYYLSIEEAKEDGKIPIKCFSPLQFYTLKGKTTNLLKENIEVIRYLYYTVYDPNVKRYYVKFFRAYPLDVLYFYRRDLTFSGDDLAVENLRRYIEDGNVTLLFTTPQVADTTSMLKRLWNAYIKGDGQLDYRIYIKLLDESLRLEDYRIYGKNLVGSQTVINQFEMKIAGLWEQAKNKVAK